VVVEIIGIITTLAQVLIQAVIVGITAEVAVSVVSFISENFK
jgi:hypothetical protein